MYNHQHCPSFSVCSLKSTLLSIYNRLHVQNVDAWLPKYKIQTESARPPVAMSPRRWREQLWRQPLGHRRASPWNASWLVGAVRWGCHCRSSSTAQVGSLPISASIAHVRGCLWSIKQIIWFLTIIHQVETYVCRFDLHLLNVHGWQDSKGVALSTYQFQGVHSSYYLCE